MTVQQAIEMHGEAGTTIKMTSSNTAKALIHDDNIAAMQNADGKLLCAVLLSVETQSIRISFTSTPSQTLGHLLVAGTILRISNPRSIAALKYRSAVDGSHGVLTATPEYRTL